MFPAVGVVMKTGALRGAITPWQARAMRKVESALAPVSISLACPRLMTYYKRASNSGSIRKGANRRSALMRFLIPGSSATAFLSSFRISSLGGGMSWVNTTDSMKRHEGEAGFIFSIWRSIRRASGYRCTATNATTSCAFNAKSSGFWAVERCR